MDSYDKNSLVYSFLQLEFNSTAQDYTDIIEWIYSMLCFKLLQPPTDN